MQRIDRRLAEADKPSAAQLYTESLLSHPSDRSVPVDRVPSYTAPTSSNTSSVKVGKIQPTQFTLKLITARVRITREGNVFSLYTWGGGRGTPLASGPTSFPGGRGCTP